MKSNIKGIPLLILTAMIWGFAFVAQRVGAEYVGAFTFNGIRFFLGAVCMGLLSFVLEPDRRTKEEKNSAEGKAKDKNTLIASLAAGTVLYAASALQQIGVSITGSAGKAGFMTGLYIVLVPIASLILFRRKTGAFLWIGAVCAVIGLYLLSNEGLTGPGLGDVCLIVGALFWTAHILVIDSFTAKPIFLIRFSMGQSLVCAVLNLICAVLFEDITVNALQGALIPLLYGGIMSAGVAYTLQIFGQRLTDPTYASILMSLESFFSAVGGALILHERMSISGYVGCVFMFAGIMLAQVGDVIKAVRAKKENKA